MNAHVTATVAIDGMTTPGAASRRRPAGPVDDLPARFLWLVDATVIAAGFAVVYAWLPLMQGAFLPTGVLGRWLSTIGVPPSAGTGGAMPGLYATVGVAGVGLLATLLWLDLLGGYRPLLGQSRTRLLLGTVMGPLAGLGVTTIILFGIKSFYISRLYLFASAGLHVVSLTAWRMGLRTYKIRRTMAGRYARGVVLIGTVAGVQKLADHFRQRVLPQIYLVVGGLVIPDQGPADEPALSVPILGPVGALGDILIRRPIDDVVVLQPDQSSAWMSGVIEACEYFSATLRIVPAALLQAGPRALHADREGDPMGLPAVVLSPLRSDGHPHFLKRLIDVVVSAAALALTAPVFAVIAAAIKVSTPDLPVFYRWRVVGYKGREFVGYKFTTMQGDADVRKAELEHLNEMQGPVFKIRNDPRMTPLGRLLRKYSLNELPQLWSVFRGDMSLVGPRPAFPHELSRYEYWHKRKLCVRPGITCLWQVRGRNAITDFDEWVRLDLKYIDEWSLWLDFKILIWTIGAVFRGTGS